jgi:thymidylate synthase
MNKVQATEPALPALEQPYLDLLQRVTDYGENKTDRTGVGTKSVFGIQMRFDLQRGFPLLTTKKVFWKAIAYELIWFLRGDNNAKWLQERGVTIWDEWANKKTGDLGPVYGVQWRSWPVFEHTMTDWRGAKQYTQVETIDQISEAIRLIKTDPDSRRIIVSSWNVADLKRMALMPCHAFFQFYVSNGKLSCQLYQRSADLFLGVPFNIASYALLTHIIARECDLEVGDFIWTGGDCHIYDNHTEQVALQLTRTPFDAPQLVFTGEKPATVFDYSFDDFKIVNYTSHAAIKAPVAV